MSQDQLSQSQQQAQDRRPYSPKQDPGRQAAPVRPVSANTYMRNAVEGPRPSSTSNSGSPLQNFTSYSNVLFGDEQGGDVLAGEPAAAKPQAEAETPRSMSVADKVQQQIALNQQKRLARLQGGLAAQSSLSRPGTPGGSHPGTPGGTSTPVTPFSANYVPQVPPPLPMTASMGGGLTSPQLSQGLTGRGLSGQLPEGMSSSPRPLLQQATSFRRQSSMQRTSSAAESQSSTAEQSLAARGLPAMYDPNEEEGLKKKQESVARLRLTATPATSSGVGASGRPQFTDDRSFVGQPGPQQGTPVQCSIVRDKSSKMYPKYTLMLDGENRFLLSARKRKKSRSSNYIISLDVADTSRHSPHFAGKVRSNFLGTEFVLYDTGDKPGKQRGEGDLRRELGGVRFEYNVLGTRGPRKMVAVVPAMDPTGEPYIFRPEVENDSILDRHKAKLHLEQILVMINKPPKWNDQLGAYTLNFQGRVTCASVKNFQLVSQTDLDRVLLQFGKVGKDKFTMDFAYPLTALQAFAICLTSFDSKLACE